MFKSIGSNWLLTLATMNDPYLDPSGRLIGLAFWRKI